MPNIPNSISAAAAQPRAYGSCVVTWSMWSHAAPKDDKHVVSDTGEQWSPKRPPPIIADTVAKTIGVSCPPDRFIAMGIENGTRMAYVPHDVPVKNEMHAPAAKVSAGSRAGVIHALVSSITYCCAPRFFEMVLMQ